MIPFASLLRFHTVPKAYSKNLAQEFKPSGRFAQVESPFISWEQAG
jgi:hypothetical protein